ncbi:MAG: sulfatase [candidate division KSB1 bacterium]|nr:sulfatase [candidate division KSB1 bacterium]
MDRRMFLKSIMTAVPAVALPLQATPRRPNIIMILVDDLGWTDLGCFGSDLYKTPNIDRMARDGVRFSDAYAACTVCSPTRASLMTGKYPARLHITDWIAGHSFQNAKLLPPDWTLQLPLEETTIAEALKNEGYSTVHIGKWHLGNEPYYPEHQGFDINKGGYHKGQPPSYFSPYQHKNSPETHIPSLEPGPAGEYLTDREAEEACGFIEKHRDEPFYINLAHYAVHIPLQAKPDRVDAYEKKIETGMKHRNPVYAAMVESVDQSLGQIRDKLDELGLLDNTVILFTGDNGGLTYRRWLHGSVTDNSPLRAGKGSAYEGGVRVPTFIWRMNMAAKGAVCPEPVISPDFYPTLLSLARGQESVHLPEEIDGTSLVPLLRRPDQQLERKAVYWHYPHYHPGGATPHSAIRARDYKLIKFYETGQTELYHIAEDIGETTDLSGQMPEKTRELHAMLNTWLKTVDAQMPRVNPAYHTSG